MPGSILTLSRERMTILAEWLNQRAENAPVAQHRNLPAMPALRIRMAWQKLKARARAEDQLWGFENPSNTWKKRGRITGYALLRDHEIVESVVVTTEKR
jgi:hypothetical protein